MGNDIDQRVYKGWTDQEIQTERFRLQAVASEASAVIGVLKTELLHRAISKATDNPLTPTP
jgi:hypothetical protein